MYLCDFCKKQVEPNVRANRLVIKTRKKVYESKVQNGARKSFVGYETQKEVNLCGECFAKELQKRKEKSEL